MTRASVVAAATASPPARSRARPLVPAARARERSEWGPGKLAGGKRRPDAKKNWRGDRPGPGAPSDERASAIVARVCVARAESPHTRFKKTDGLTS